MEKGRVRSLDIQSRVDVSKLVGELVESGVTRRLEEIFIRIFWLVVLILNHLVIVVFRLVAVLGHRVPNLGLVEFSQPYLISSL